MSHEACGFLVIGGSKCRRPSTRFYRTRNLELHDRLIGRCEDHAYWIAKSRLYDEISEAEAAALTVHEA